MIIEYQNGGTPANEFEVMTEVTAERNAYNPIDRMDNVNKEYQIMLDAMLGNQFKYASYDEYALDVYGYIPD